jgi:para-aminobenzoate synthetase
MVVYRPSILFIDAYDSFTNNIISLLTAALGCSVRVIHIDSPGFETDEALRNELRHYDAVVCGPGPGDPSNQKDVGLMNRIWKLKEEDVRTSWTGAEDSPHWGN